MGHFAAIHRAARLLAPLVVACCAGSAAASPVAPQVEARCREWHRSLADEIDAAGVRDAYGARLASFPHLRSDRFLASFAGEPLSGDRLKAWWGHLYATQGRALAAETGNLPAAARERLEATRARLGVDREICAEALRAGDLDGPSARERLVEESAAVPSDYAGWQRLLGLYPVTALGVGLAVQAWQDRTRALFAGRVERFAFDGRPVAPVPVRRYVPPAPLLPWQGIAEGLASLERDALGVPRLPEDARALLRAYAPVLDVEEGGEADRIGRLEWDEQGRPALAAEAPAAYGFVSHTRVGERVLLQLNYVFWFAERPCAGPLDILCGRLDGLHWRVTLAPDGRVWVGDTIHPCGCYHLFFPTPLARQRAVPHTLEEIVFVAQELPEVASGARLVLRLQASTHYLVQVRVERAEEETGATSARPAAGTDREKSAPSASPRSTRYALLDYDALRSLPLPEGGRRSLFGPEGLVAGTERAERWLLWPTGVREPGAMRQHGRHATAFVGERHFDEARLLDRRFELLD